MFVEVEIMDESQIKICQETISSNTFFYMVCDHILKHDSMSVVRMGDGEALFLSEFERLTEEQLDLTLDNIEILTSIGLNLFNSQRLTRMGLIGLTPRKYKEILEESVNTCTYFAPNISGLHTKEYRLYDFFPHRTKYVDNFFINQWSVEQIRYLYKISEGVRLVHKSIELADAFQAAYGNKFQYTQLTNWDQSERVLKEIENSPEQLILLSGSKHIITRAAQYGKVVIDVGNAADQWRV